MKKIEEVTGNQLTERLLAGPQITFTEARGLFGPVIQCKWGVVLLGNGDTREEAIQQALMSIKDMSMKLLAAMEEKDGK